MRSFSPLRGQRRLAQYHCWRCPIAPDRRARLARPPGSGPTRASTHRWLRYRPRSSQTAFRKWPGVGGGSHPQYAPFRTWRELLALNSRAARRETPAPGSPPESAAPPPPAKQPQYARACRRWWNPRSKTLSSSSPRISPAVATTSPPNRFLAVQISAAPAKRHEFPAA